MGFALSNNNGRRPCLGSAHCWMVAKKATQLIWRRQRLYSIGRVRFAPGWPALKRDRQRRIEAALHATRTETQIDDASKCDTEITGDQQRAEALADRRHDRRSVVFSPKEVQPPAGAGPRNLDPAALDRQRAILGCVGCKLVQRQRQRVGPAAVETKFRSGNRCQITVGAMGRQRLFHDVDYREPRGPRIRSTASGRRLAPEAGRRSFRRWRRQPARTSGARSPGPPQGDSRSVLELPGDQGAPFTCPFGPRERGSSSALSASRSMSSSAGGSGFSRRPNKRPDRLFQRASLLTAGR